MSVGEHERSIVGDLAEFTRALCGTRAVVTESSSFEAHIPTLNVIPRRRGAKGISIIGEQQIVLTVGRGLRWELDYTDNDVAEARKIIRAVVEGRGTGILRWPRLHRLQAY
ncbi:MAG TPA: hypothetical protein VF156_00535 [Agromyces sp.]